MDLNGYFEPVSLDRPAFELLDEQAAFSHHITIHTPDQPIRDLDRHEVAIVGIPDDRNAFLKGSGKGPDKIRTRLYQLRHPRKGLSVYDLGNIKTGGTSADTYFALRDILLELRERNIRVLLLGGSQDLGHGVFLALEKTAGLHHVLTMDAMLDFSAREEALHSRNYLNYLFGKDKRNHFSYTNLGHQAYFVTETQLGMLEKSHLESIRLGDARRNIQAAEPLVRDAEFLSIDLCAVRHSDAPGSSTPSPNGFFADEVCQVARYAGLSEKNSILGMFEFNPSMDMNGQGAHLCAQAAWYYLDGIGHCIKENPLDSPGHITKFIVHIDAAGHDILFHKSTLSDRWWMEIPVKNMATGHNFFISCTYEDYQLACKNEIPDRWWRYLHRLGTENE
ncbi:MAG: formimidoylglutamase [Bacteroidales bacterium]